MGTASIYMTAGLPVAKNSGQSNDVGKFYVTAGLPAEVLTGGTARPKTGHSLASRSILVGGGLR